MLELKWKDVTSYSRDDKEREPSAWGLNLGDGLAITITKGHIYHPGVWVMHCFSIGMKEIEIGADTLSLQDVQRRSIDMVRARLEKWCSLMPQRDYADALETEGEG